MYQAAAKFYGIPEEVAFEMIEEQTKAFDKLTKLKQNWGIDFEANWLESKGYKQAATKAKKLGKLNLV